MVETSLFFNVNFYSEIRLKKLVDLIYFLFKFEFTFDHVRDLLHIFQKSLGEEDSSNNPIQ